jgi:hypothetical protein
MLHIREGEEEKCIQLLVIKSEGKSPLIDLSLVGRIILTWILKK